MAAIAGLVGGSILSAGVGGAINAGIASQQFGYQQQLQQNSFNFQQGLINQSQSALQKSGLPSYLAFQGGANYAQPGSENQIAGSNFYHAPNSSYMESPFHGDWVQQNLGTGTPQESQNVTSLPRPGLGLNPSTQAQTSMQAAASSGQYPSFWRAGGVQGGLRPTDPISQASTSPIQIAGEGSFGGTFHTGGEEIPMQQFSPLQAAPKFASSSYANASYGAPQEIGSFFIDPLGASPVGSSRATLASPPSVLSNQVSVGSQRAIGGDPFSLSRIYK